MDPFTRSLSKRDVNKDDVYTDDEDDPLGTGTDIGKPTREVSVSHHAAANKKSSLGFGMFRRETKEPENVHHADLHASATANGTGTEQGLDLSVQNPNKSKQKKGANDHTSSQPNGDVINQIRAFYNRQTQKVEDQIIGRHVRWLFDVTCGRYRSKWFYPLVFLVPVSVCVTVFMWPMLLPSELVQNAYSGATKAAMACMYTTENSVAPMMAEAYVRNRERCKTECPTPSHAAYVLCHNTEACGGENAADAAADALASGRLPGLRGGPGGFSPGGGGGPGGGDGSDEDTTTRRKLLFGAPGMDGIADAGISPDLVNEIESSSLEAASPCTACKITAEQVFISLADAENQPSPQYVEAMVRVHGREWCARQAREVLPPYDKWKHFKGITSWTQIGHTPADKWTTWNATIFGGAETLVADRSTSVDVTSTWPVDETQNSSSGSIYNPDAWNPNNCSSNVTASPVSYLEGTGNDPDVPCVNRTSEIVNAETGEFVDMPVNEDLMRQLMASSPNFGCKKHATGRDLMPEAFRTVARVLPNSELTPRPKWADTCIAVPGVTSYGYVGSTQQWSKDTLGLGSTASIMGPTAMLFPLFILNAVGMIRFVETPFVACGICAWGWIFYDNLVAFLRFLPCMDVVFVTANVVHLGIVGSAVLAALGMIGTRVADPTAEKSVYNLETHSWKKFMKEMVAGAPVANFSVQRANVIVRGNARLLASPQVQHMLGSHGVGSIPQSAIFLKKLLRGQDPLNTLNKSSPERGWLPFRLFWWMGNSGLPKDFEKRLKKTWTKIKYRYLRRPDPDARRVWGDSHVSHENDETAFSRGRRSSERWRRASSKSVTFKLHSAVSVNERHEHGPRAASAQLKQRSTPVLMAIWREAVSRVVQARAAQRVLAVNQDGTPSWRTEIPKHSVGIGSRMMLAIFGTAFITFTCLILSLQQMRKFVEVLQWSFAARWCIWKQFGIHDPALVNQILVTVVYIIPPLTVCVVVVQLIDLTRSYRSQLQLLRCGKSNFSKRERNEKETSASEWVGYQLVLGGFTYLAVFVVACIVAVFTTIPIVVFLSIGAAERGQAISFVYLFAVAWFTQLIGSQAFRQFHKHTFTDKRLNVIRYMHYYQFSDFVMLYFTMQRSFVVVVFRTVWAVLIQTACLMRTDMSFFPPTMGALVDPPHLSYVSMVLSDWKRHCPIVRSFVTLLTGIAEQYDEGRSRIARGILFDEKGRVGADTKTRWEGHVDHTGRRLKTRAFVTQLKSAWANHAGDRVRQESMDRTAVSKFLNSPEFSHALDAQMRVRYAARRARTRWFLAITLTNNPSLIKMRHPRGVPVTYAAQLLTRPKHLPHFIKRGWLRRRGGVLGLMGVVSDDYLVVTPGVLYIFEHDQSVVSRAYPLNDRVKIRRLFVTNADQTSGGWHFTRDYYRPEPTEFGGEDPETGDLLVDDSEELGDDRSDSTFTSFDETFRVQRGNVHETGDVLSLSTGKKYETGDKESRKSLYSQASAYVASTVTRRTLYQASAYVASTVTSRKGNEKWKLRQKHFFALTVPGGPMEIFAATSELEAKEWFEVLRSEAFRV